MHFTFVLAFFLAVLSAVFRSDTYKMVFNSLSTAAIYFSAVNKKILKHFTRLIDISIRQEINKELKRVINGKFLIGSLVLFSVSDAVQCTELLW